VANSATMAQKEKICDLPTQPQTAAEKCETYNDSRKEDADQSVPKSSRNNKSCAPVQVLHTRKFRKIREVKENELKELKMRPSDIKYVMEIWHSHLPKPEEDLQDSIFKLSLRQLHEILSEVVIDQAKKPRAKEAEANHHQPPYSSRQDPQIPSYEEQAQEPTMRVVNHWHQQPYHRGIPDPPPWSDPQQEEEEQHEKIVLNFAQEAVDTMHEEMNSREANMNAMDAKLNRITIMVQQLIERAQNQPYQYHPFNPPLSQQYQPNPTMFEQQREPPQEMMPLQQLTTLQMPPTEYQVISTSKPEDYSCNSQTVKNTVIDATVIDAISIKPEDDDEEEPVSLKEVNPVSP
jgi:hypothetical protein